MDGLEGDLWKRFGILWIRHSVPRDSCWYFRICFYLITIAGQKFDIIVGIEIAIASSVPSLISYPKDLHPNQIFLLSFCIKPLTFA